MSLRRILVLKDYPLASYSQTISQSVFGEMFAESEVRISDEPEREVYANKMAMTLLSGGPLRIVLKAHFNEKDFLPHLGKELVADALKEFCNRVAGPIKNFLNENNFEIGVGLPMLTHGFDEIFFEIDSKDAQVFRRQSSWSLSSEKHHLIFSVLLECRNRDTLFRLNKVIDSSDDNKSEAKGGDVEFL